MRKSLSEWATAAKAADLNRVDQFDYKMYERLKMEAERRLAAPKHADGPVPPLVGVVAQPRWTFARSSVNTGGGAVAVYA